MSVGFFYAEEVHRGDQKSRRRRAGGEGVVQPADGGTLTFRLGSESLQIRSVTFMEVFAELLHGERPSNLPRVPQMGIM